MSSDHDPDGLRPVPCTAVEAARLLDVPVSTVRSWHDRGDLVPIGRLATRGRPWLYAVTDVIAAERTTRHADPTRRRARRLAQQAIREV